MVDVRPFRGVRYDPQRVGSLEQVLAPPYDVISPSQRERLCSLSPFNVVRLILSSGAGDSRYSRAARLFREWRASGVLVREAEPAIYPVYQEFEHEGRRVVRKGFIAVVGLEEFSSGNILPHEQTFDAPKADRLKLITACNANLSPVFSIYSDESGEVERAIDEALDGIEPLIDASDGDGVRTTMWRLPEPDIHGFVSARLARGRLLIADGHHRYETALAFRNMMRLKEGIPPEEKRPYDYVMMYLARAECEGLVIKPTHRVVKELPRRTHQAFLQGLAGKFLLEESRCEEAAPYGLAPSEICLYLGRRVPARLLRPKNPPSDPSEGLAVILLHGHVLGDGARPGEVEYVKSVDEAVALVDSGRWEAAFILPPLRAVDIMDVVVAGRKLPQKSTYFYPKVLSGLVFHAFD